MKLAESFYEKRGWKVANVARVRGGHSGYDLFLEKGAERLTVEVKGCSKLYQIPDLYSTEIDKKTMRLIADELCVVYFEATDQPPQIACIPRNALQPEHIIPKYGYRISGRFKNERTIKPFIVEQADTQNRPLEYPNQVQAQTKM